MIFILGGASRSGKTLLAHRAVLEKGMSYFPLDALVEGVVSGAPKVGVVYSQSFQERATRLWPVAKPLIGFLFHQRWDFLVEGDTILPSQVHELQQESGMVKSCFLGYADMESDEKLAHIRFFQQGASDWTNNLSDDTLLAQVDVMIEFSNYLRDECAKYGIRYVDVSKDFAQGGAEAFQYLFTY